MTVGAVHQRVRERESGGLVVVVVAVAVAVVLVVCKRGEGAGTRDRPKGDFRLPKLGLVAGDDDVAQHGELTPTTKCVAASRRCQRVNKQACLLKRPGMVVVCGCGCGCGCACECLWTWRQGRGPVHCGDDGLPDLDDLIVQAGP